jgi:NAD(P)-dependent dehydrogenase (short-subunit alcohol dehydrogenase family)
MADSCFTGKTAVVTGAGGTLCSAVARELAREGARVALVGRTLAKLEMVAASIRAAGGVALPIVCDVTDAAAVERAQETCTRELGGCDFLINGAGGNQAEAITTLTEFNAMEFAADRPAGTRGFFDLDLARFEEVVRINTLGTVIPCQVFGREMARRGRGSILNFASMNSYRPLTRVPAYALAKAGVVSFTAWLSVYLAPAGIRVNAVAPGFFVNERSRKILMTPDGGLSDRGRTVMAQTPMKRFGEAEELLGAVCWLLDDTRAGFVTGVTLPVDGGFLAGAGV